MGLVVKNAVKKSTKLRTSGDFIKALDKHVAEIMKNAEVRCKANGRATIRPCDL